VTSFYILTATDENSFDLDSVDKVPNIRANLAEDVQVRPRKVSVTVRLSRTVKFKNSPKHREHNRK